MTRAAAGWMIALACASAGAARADGETIVVPAEAATGKVDAAVLGAAARGVKQAAPSATVADASLADSAFILGCDPATDYRTPDLQEALREHCPKGVDVYFDNVGGEILDAVLPQLPRSARIVICGAISQYNNTTPVKGPSNYLSLLVNRASMTGMVVFDYAPRYAEATAELAAWIKAGQLKSRWYSVAGLETFPETLLKLFKGENTGKLVLKV